MELPLRVSFDILRSHFNGMRLLELTSSSLFTLPAVATLRDEAIKFDKDLPVRFRLQTERRGCPGKRSGLTSKGALQSTFENFKRL